MVKAADFVRLVKQALDEGWGYIWGRYGQVWTKANQAAATRATTVKYGAKWIGKRVADCSGLGYWAFRELGMTIYHGSNTIWREYVTGRSELKYGVRTDSGQMLPGDPVFLVRAENGVKNRHHIGYYVGGDTVIEAASTIKGVITSPVSKWHETAHWKGVEYEGGIIFMDYPTLKKGSKGADVVTMQSLLVKHGYTLPPTKSAADGIDGIFGANTEAVLMKYQQDHELPADGVCGDATWESLTGEVPSGDIPADCVLMRRARLKEMQTACRLLMQDIDEALEG